MTPEPTLPASPTPAASVQPTQDERIMAALSHIGIVLPMTGLLLPVFIWLTQKEKSPYVRFQALQAAAWHLALIVFSIAGGMCYGCTAFSTFLFIPLVAANQPRNDPSPLIVLPIFFPILTILLVMAGVLVFFIAGVVAAVLTLQGKDFRFPILGRRVEKFLEAK